MCKGELVRSEGLKLTGSLDKKGASNSNRKNHIKILKFSMSL